MFWWMLLLVVLWLVGQGIYIAIDIARQGWEKPHPVVQRWDPTWEDVEDRVRQHLMDHPDFKQRACAECDKQSVVALVKYYCEEHEPDA